MARAALNFVTYISLQPSPTVRHFLGLRALHDRLAQSSRRRALVRCVGSSSSPKKPCSPSVTVLSARQGSRDNSAVAAESSPAAGAGAGAGAGTNGNDGLMHTMRRRDVLEAMALCVLGLFAGNSFTNGTASVVAWADSDDQVMRLSDAEWRDRLDSAAYAVLRKGGTEMPFSSRLNDEKRNGTFVCAGCGQALYSSTKKYNSGTGWPSFWDALPGAIALHSNPVDKVLLLRTEVRCARCDGHIGHVFDDGPRPTGKRYCMNGAAMGFVPAADRE